MDYDVVLKFENYRDEERYLLRSLGLGSAVEQKWEVACKDQGSPDKTEESQRKSVDVLVLAMSKDSLGCSLKCFGCSCFLSLIGKS